MTRELKNRVRIENKFKSIECRVAGTARSAGAPRVANTEIPDSTHGFVTSFKHDRTIRVRDGTGLPQVQFV